jgi:hypothetical protein
VILDIPRCDGVGKPLKKPTLDQAAPGLEPGTSRMQSGALGAWPPCSVYRASTAFALGRGESPPTDLDNLRWLTVPNPTHCQTPPTPRTSHQPKTQPGFVAVLRIAARPTQQRPNLDLGALEGCQFPAETGTRVRKGRGRGSVAACGGELARSVHSLRDYHGARDHFGGEPVVGTEQQVAVLNEEEREEGDTSPGA